MLVDRVKLKVPAGNRSTTVKVMVPGLSVKSVVDNIVSKVAPSLAPSALTTKAPLRIRVAVMLVNVTTTVTVGDAGMPSADAGMADAANKRRPSILRIIIGIGPSGIFYFVFNELRDEPCETRQLRNHKRAKV